MSRSKWTPERREAQRQRAKQLYDEGKFGGPNRGQGRKPKPKPDVEATCPGCGTTVLLSQGTVTAKTKTKGVGMERKHDDGSFMVMRSGEVVEIDEEGLPGKTIGGRVSLSQPDSDAERLDRIEEAVALIERELRSR